MPSWTSADYGRRRDAPAPDLLLGERERAIGAVLPEVDPGAEPVVGVVARDERLATEETLRDVSVAAVVPDDGSVVAHVRVSG